MILSSTNGAAPSVSFREALAAGLAPDGGLYLPEELPRLGRGEIRALRGCAFPQICAAVATALISDEVPPRDLVRIVNECFDFPVPLVAVEPGIHALELFHGPTLAFKDFGARFLAHMTRYFAAEDVVVLVATSGDTGSAVAHGFAGIDGARVILLYPSGGVSYTQEKQLTTVGENVLALEVEGTFDDCQRLVKAAFADKELMSQVRLTSANSINIGRLLPQMFYYFAAWAALDVETEVDFSVPSGNFGNLTAGVLAKRMGLPVRRFIAATNVNDAVPEYLESGTFRPRPSRRTVSNAMDVGDPSNMARLVRLYGGSVEAMRKEVSGAVISDDETIAAIKQVRSTTGYLLDPHGAVAYLGLKKARVAGDVTPGVFLETAHPAKFAATVEEATRRTVPMPEALAAAIHKPKQSTLMKPEIGALREMIRSFAGKASASSH